MVAGRTEFNRSKFKELVLHLAQVSAKDEGFGMVKLNKLLYRSDFEAFRLLGHSITGATYQHQEFGPVAREMLPVVDELGRAGYLAWAHVESGPYTRTVPEAIEAADLSQFTNDELQIVSDALSELSTMGGKRVSEWSHEESAGWLVTQDGEEITYESGLIDTSPLDEKRLTLLREYVSGLSA